jgi:hypothetical protein
MSKEERLLTAAEEGNVAEVQALILQGANIEYQDPDVSGICFCRLRYEYDVFRSQMWHRVTCVQPCRGLVTRAMKALLSAC